MIRAILICIASDSASDRYIVAEQYPIMRELYAGNDLVKVMEAIQGNPAEALLGDHHPREQRPAEKYRVM